VGFEPTISAGERPQTYDLDRAAIDIVLPNIFQVIKSRRMRWAGHVARIRERKGV